MLLHIVATASACCYRSATSSACSLIQIQPASHRNGTLSPLTVNIHDSFFLLKDCIKNWVQQLFSVFLLFCLKWWVYSPYWHNIPISISPSPPCPLPFSLSPSLSLSFSLLYPCPLTPLPLPLHIWFRTEDREFAPRLKTAENANIQPNPGLILRAEPTVTNILKVVQCNLI